jgi:hypothetical protein
MGMKPYTLEQTEATCQWFDERNDPLEEHPLNPINQEGYEEHFPHPEDRWWEEDAATVSEVMERMRETHE